MPDHGITHGLGHHHSHAGATPRCACFGGMDVDHHRATSLLPAALDGVPEGGRGAQAVLGGEHGGGLLSL